MLFRSVATDVPGTRDLVTHEVTGLLVPLNDVAALREALIAVVDDARAYGRMSDAARSTADAYSWSAVSTEFDQIYAQAHERLRAKSARPRRAADPSRPS